ncbi:TetR/AcrR family transcriptional regulator [Roseibium aggregatum]|uniref:TetR/AcrR family transcriptional regulator n=1 Tax=Roseibium aggregatum TaxID=187304 RepID=A0A939EET8_9HYPH|nr:TetR/AcrR family transcriptional regulator [Roseibium aggregatum]MBN9671840.1 TetR/AcrR family transcriptional regulator [Roseibium aggregatum]
MTDEPATERPKPYHHGNLVDELLRVTVEIIEEKGVDQLSMREVARRAGVSPGAPFQHFASKSALLTAVAEQAMQRLVDAVSEAQDEVATEAPLRRLEAIGQGYLRWALANPTHFEVISSRKLIDFASSLTLQAQNDAIRHSMVELLTLAKANGNLPSERDIQELVLACRAYVYGLARMVVDDHFREWQITGEAETVVLRSLNGFITSLSRTG